MDETGGRTAGQGTARETVVLAFGACLAKRGGKEEKTRMTMRIIVIQKWKIRDEQRKQAETGKRRRDLDVTGRDLRQFESLMAEIEEDRARLARLARRQEEIEYTLGVGNLIGGDDYLRTAERLERNIARCMGERDRIAGYIDGVPDSLTRRALRLRYVDRLPWSAVAARMGYACESGPRQLCARFLSGQ